MPPGVEANGRGRKESGASPSTATGASGAPGTALQAVTKEELFVVIFQTFMSCSAAEVFSNSSHVSSHGCPEGVPLESKNLESWTRTSKRT